MPIIVGPSRRGTDQLYGLCIRLVVFGSLYSIWVWSAMTRYGSIVWFSLCSPYSTGKTLFRLPRFFAKYRELIDIKWQSRRSFLFLFLFLSCGSLLCSLVFISQFFSFSFLFPLQLRFCWFTSGSGSFEGGLSFFRLVIIALVDCV